MLQEWKRSCRHILKMKTRMSEEFNRFAILNQLMPEVEVGAALVGPDTPPFPPSPEPRKPQVKLDGEIHSHIWSH